MNAIWATSLISLLLGLINIGSHKALENVLSFTVSSWEAAASIPLGLLLWSRITGRIRSAPDTFDGYQNDRAETLTWDPGVFLSHWVLVSMLSA
jgi:choline transport protein